jgi:hypothetical protein
LLQDSPIPLDPLVQLDVFTLVPHAYAWLTEQRPVAAILGGELELRLFNYRATTPLRAGQVDDEPYGGGAGMLLRVDVAAAALDAVFLWLCLRLHRRADRRSAVVLFHYSLAYLALLFAAMAIDHLL